MRRARNAMPRAQRDAERVRVRQRAERLPRAPSRQRQPRRRVQLAVLNFIFHRAVKVPSAEQL